MSGIKRIRKLLSGATEDKSLRCRSRQTNEDCIVEALESTSAKNKQRFQSCCSCLLSHQTFGAAYDRSYIA